MKARKIFDEMMQEANAWRASLDAEVAAVGVSAVESESDIAFTDSSQSSVAVCDSRPSVRGCSCVEVASGDPGSVGAGSGSTGGTRTRKEAQH